MNLNSLSTKDFEEIFHDIVFLKKSDDEIKQFLLELNNQNLPENAFIGAISVLKKFMKPIESPANLIDVCGTGGDGLNTLNISTAVCFILAGAGLKIAKHGNKAVSSKSGSADIFSELGIKIFSDKLEIEKSLSSQNLTFLFAPFFHESLKNLLQIRKSLGVATIFNFLGPLLNPANTNIQLIGVSKKFIMPKMLNAIKYQNPNAKIYMVHGFDGMDEISISNNSYLLTLENGKISQEEIINPNDYGFKKHDISKIIGKDPTFNAQKLLDLLNGEKSAYRDIVILNSAFALKLAEKTQNIEEAINLANKSIDNGLALEILEQIRK